MPDYVTRDDYERGASDYHAAFCRWLNMQEQGGEPIYPRDPQLHVLAPFLEAYRKGEVRYVSPAEAERDFAKAMGATEPPLGIVPARLWREERVQALTGAIDRFVEGGSLGPSALGKLREWMRELDGHLDWLASIRERHNGA